MILTSVMDYPATQRRLYNILSDFDGLEQLATQYGAEVTGRIPGDPTGQDRAWDMIVTARGLSRNVSARVADLTPDSGFLVAADSDGLLADIRVDIAPTPDNGARVTFSATLSARKLTARVLMQSLRLARGTLEAKFHDRVVAYTRARLKAARQAQTKA